LKKNEEGKCIVELKGEEDVYSNSRQIEYSIKHGDVEYTGHTVMVVTHTFCVAGSFFLHSFRPVPWCWPLTTTEESKANHYVVTHKHGVGVDGCYCM